MSEATIEQEIQDKGKTAARVKPEDITAAIASAHFFTAAQGAAHHQAVHSDLKAFALDGVPELGSLTFCVIVLRNGFTVTGESACASPDNFDAEIGRKIAYENARNKIWALEGYLLKQRLHDAQ